MFTETPRLLIRDLEREDLAGLLAISSDPAVSSMNEGYLPADEAALGKWLDETMEHNARQPRQSHNCAVILKATSQLIGYIGFGVPSEPGQGDIDFGYALNHAYWNQGYMTEAVRSMLAYCFDVIGAHTVTAYHLDFNPASGRVMQKAGMRLDQDKMHDQQAGEVHYILTAEDWRH